MRYVTAGYVADELVDRYGLSIDIWDVVKLSASCMKRIGVFATQRKLIGTMVKNFKVHLPCDAYLARGCVRIPAEMQSTKITIVDGIQQPPQIVFVQPVQEPFTNNVEFLKPNYIDQIRGQYIDFDYEHPILKFNETNVNVVIEYSGIVVDENDIPMIPESCWEACMMYCVFTRTQAQYRLNQVPRNIVKDFEEWKNIAIVQARAKATMQALTSNEKDKLLNIMVSMDRKAYNLPS